MVQKHIAEPTQLWERIRFTRSNREANSLGKIEESDKLNALWSGRGLCRLVFFKTCCRTDITVHFIDEHSVLRYQAQRGYATQKYTGAQKS